MKFIEHRFTIFDLCEENEMDLYSPFFPAKFAFLLSIEVMKKKMKNKVDFGHEKLSMIYVANRNHRNLNHEKQNHQPGVISVVSKG